MAIIGNLIKKALEISQHFQPATTPQQIQQEQLIHLLSKARNTAFGKYYGFGQILESDQPIQQFQQNIPIFQYNTIQPWWDKQQHFPDITWPGKPDYFALSSGTTGKKSKRIPVTNDMLKSFQSVSLSQIGSLANYDFPPSLFEKEVLALGSSANLKPKNGHLEGEISGINTYNAPDWFDFFYQPGQDIAEIDNWEDRLSAIVQQAPNWDIGAIAGIPSWVLIMLKKIKSHIG